MTELNCRRCGSGYEAAKSDRDGAFVCPECAAQPSRISGMAVASVVCGIVGFIPPLGLIAVVLGIRARNEIRSANGWLGGRRLATAGIITGAVGCALMLVAVIVPVLSQTRMQHRRIQGAYDGRGIHQGQIFFAVNNDGWYVGFDRRGLLETDHVFDGEEQSTDWNGYDQSTPRAPAWRMRRLLDNKYFTPEYCISPSETKQLWEPGGSIDPSNFSWAMLKITDDADSLRNSEHRDTDNALAVVYSDRAIGNGAGYTSVYAGPTTPDTVSWFGWVGWNDGHATWEGDAFVATRYRLTGRANDNLFSDDSPPDRPDADAAMAWKSAGDTDAELVE